MQRKASHSERKLEAEVDVETATVSSALKLRGDINLCVEAVLRRVREGSLHPGEQIRQAKLASDLGISRTPLRHALAVLASDNVIRHVPNSGYFVASLSKDELDEVYMMRELLERRLYESLNWEALDFNALKSIQAEMEAAGRVPDIHKFTSENRKFHFAIFDASPLRLTIQIVDKLWSMTEAYRSLHVIDTAVRAQAIEEHRGLLKALSDRDVTATIAIACQQRESSLSDLKRFGNLRRGSAGWTG